MKQPILLLILSSLLLWSCSNAEEWSGSDTDGSIRFEISFAGTRAVTHTDFTTSWEDGDQIGIFAVKSNTSLGATSNIIHNQPLTYTNGEWSAAYWPNDANKYENLDFYAYYPYEVGIDPTTHTFSVQANQSTGADYSKSDLLLANTTNIARNSVVRLTFSHALSLVQVEVKREVNISPFVDTDFTVTLTDVLPDVSLNWTPTLTGKGTPTNIIMHKVAGMDYTYRALIPAQTLSAESKVTFKQTTTGKEIDMVYRGLATSELKAKATHNYSIALGWGINPDHIYAIGNPYPHIGPTIGIVYHITDGGKHGKVVSLDEGKSLMWAQKSDVTGATNESNGLINMATIARYIKENGVRWNNFPAFGWVHSKNSSSETYSDEHSRGVWYLPAWDELKTLREVYVDSLISLNDQLTAAGGTGLSANYYWSSSEADRVSIYGSYFVSGAKVQLLKGETQNNLRAVLAF